MSEELIFLSPEQERVISAVERGENVLVTGSAGTGKSTILRELKQLYGFDLPVCASTGIAAVNVGGTTVHSWAGLGMGTDSSEELIQKHLEWRGKAYKRIRKAKRLAIDEVSMIHGRLFNLMDEVFRAIRENPLPFGGIQLILFGDFLQLPPVSKGEEQQEFAFQSRAWQDAKFKVAMLTRVFRQQDQAFADALNRVRVGDLSPEVRSMLKSRFRAPDPDPEIEPVTVYTHNEDVERMNEERLREIEGDEKTWRAVDWGADETSIKLIQKNCLAPETLRLKIGAQVMLLWNVDPYRGLANGSIGTVEDWAHSGLPMVRFRNGVVEEIEKKQWTIKQGSDVMAERSQVPLRLAWAITAHKSQGMTLDKIRVYLDRAFESGQAYVALSRARTLDGLFIESTREGCIKASPSAVRFYEECAKV